MRVASEILWIRKNCSRSSSLISDLCIMSVDQAIKWLFIGLIALINLILLSFCNIELQWTDLALPAFCGILLGGFAIHYHLRGDEPLVLCMVSLIQMGCYTSMVVVTIYSGISLAFPLTDHWLRAVDEWVGFSPVALVDWIRRHPHIENWSTWAYLFIVPETLFTILALSFLGKRVLMEQFVLQFMLGTFFCAIVGTFLPAWGPIHGYGISPSHWQQMYVDQLAALCSGNRFLLSWKETEGLITFPSFHTAWAVFLMLAWRQQTRWLSVPISIISILIIISTLTTGSHYLIDVIGGLVLAAICFAISQRVTGIAYHADGSPRVIEVLNPSMYLRRATANRQT